ncbi:DNA polymerase III subunit beta [Fuscibacter oryzae]|uniref:Beta sliding clamp n=1 Tax=Fuscibacter oryzae TaxID=2803939 RepID=A0A8J7MUN5_9RHOB|nr:hypothetical protein [Fuscibacter oryzae]MBL4929365.1 hypothetical protein [Fuscibacter oryzae]
MTKPSFTPSSVTVDAAALRNALAFARSIVERWNTIPILGLVRLTYDIEGLLHIEATDLDIEGRIEIEATGDYGFDAMLDPRFLGGLVQFHSGPVTISRVEADILTVEAGDMTARLREICPVTDWPVRDDLPGWTEASAVGEAVLHKAISHAMASISTEETRYYLNGIYLHGLGEKDGTPLRLVSTDGHRMTVYDTDVAWPHLAAIVPSKTAKLLHWRLLKGGNGAIAITSQVAYHKDKDGKEKPWAARLRFAGNGWAITSKMIDGTYPDYTRVIPSPVEDIAVTLNYTALRRFPHLDRFRAQAVEINPDAGRMSIRDPEGTVVSMPCVGKGKPFGLNLRYLKDFARSSGTVRITGSTDKDPFRVLSEDPALTQVIMPMRV